MRKVSLATLLMLLFLAAAALAWQAGLPPLPPPYHSESVRNGPQVIARPADAKLNLPPGFQVEVYAEGFDRPRFMLQADPKAVLLSDSDNEGSVYVLVDENGGFKAENTYKIIDNFYRPYGLAFWKDYLYVAGTLSVKRYKWDAKARKVLDEGQEVVSIPEFKQGHWTRTVLFDRDGEKMYVSIGSGSNVDPDPDPRRAAINRYNPDGSGHEIHAEGLRNVIGLRWYPGTNDLWAAVQERDGLGDDLVPDYFVNVKQGGFYGWPYAYIGPREEPRRAGEKPELVKKTLVPDVLLGAHVAVLDHIFYTGSQFPEKYRGGAFLALHGSWNRAKRVGYSVVFIPFQGGKPAGPREDFLTGFMMGPDQREVWGRPVGLLQLPDGSLLVSDDGGNKVWRISYKR